MKCKVCKKEKPVKKMKYVGYVCYECMDKVDESLQDARYDMYDNVIYPQIRSEILEKSNLNFSILEEYMNNHKYYEPFTIFSTFFTIAYDDDVPEHIRDIVYDVLEKLHADVRDDDYDESDENSSETND